MDKGLIHIYCGDGKGKTTAALGLSLRAAGADFKIYIVQFLKGSDTSELAVLKSLKNVTVIRGNIPKGFTWQLNDEQKLQIYTEHNRIFNELINFCKNDDKTLLVLDEIIGSYDKNLIDRKMVLDFLIHKPANVEVVMTGRNPDKTLINLADYVSEIKKIKHPIDKGITARKGIEK